MQQTVWANAYDISSGCECIVSGSRLVMTYHSMTDLPALLASCEGSDSELEFAHKVADESPELGSYINRLK